MSRSLSVTVGYPFLCPDFKSSRVPSLVVRTRSVTPLVPVVDPPSTLCCRYHIPLSI